MSNSETRPEGCSVVTVERRLTAAIKTEVAMSEIPQTQRTLRPRLAAAVKFLDVGTVGHTLTLWHMPENGRLHLEPGILISRAFPPAGEIVPSELPAGRAAHFLLVGSYEGLPGAWQLLFDWCATEGLNLAGINWEIYDESQGSEGQPQIELYALLK